jgi:hypothetical protein
VPGEESLMEPFDPAYHGPFKPMPKALTVNASAFLDKWREERIAANPAPSDVLYHYTNVAALMNIFRTNELWATNAVYTNDQTEILHSVVQLKQIVEPDRANRVNDPAGDAMLIVADEFYTIVEAYLVCFCSNGDLLSQWRGYGQQGGYAIGVDPTRFAHLVDNVQVMLVPVVYDPAEQDRLLRDLVGRWRAAFKDVAAAEDDPQMRRMGAFVFAQAFSYLAMNFKNQAFAEEQEWRLVYRRQVIFQDDGSGLTVRFRDRDGNVTPYVALKATPKEDSASRFPARRIVMGPTKYPNLAGFGLMRFLRSLGYPPDSIAIDLSTVPLRT